MGIDSSFITVEIDVEKRARHHVGSYPIASGFCGFMTATQRQYVFGRRINDE